MKNDNHVWDNKLPTAQMLGRWQPWHPGHQKLFEEIIKKTLLEIGANKKDLQNLIVKAKKIETNSVQILEFTKEVKNMDETKKIKIIETLWRIIYSNKEADIYETNLMRRLEGLLYINSDIMGSIKDRIKKESK